MKNFSRALSALALLAWGAVMVYFYHSGRLTSYVIPFYRPLVAVSGYALLGIAVSILYTLRPGARWQAAGIIADDAADEVSSPTRVRVIQVLSFATLMLPVWAAGVTTDGFSASTVRNRGVVDDASRLPAAARNSAVAVAAAAAPAAASANELPLPGATPVPANGSAGGGPLPVEQYMKTTSDGHLIADVPDLLFSAEDDAVRNQLNGRTVEVVGQYLPGKDLPNGRFQIVRMFMVCCAADARPVAVVSEKAPAGSPVVAEMGWARVTGKLSFPVEDGRRVPVIHTEKLTPCDPPAEAMLY